MEHNFRFCNSFLKKWKVLGFHLIFRRIDIQKLVYTTLLVATILSCFTINNLHLFVPNFFPSSETQVEFHEYTKGNSFTLPFAFWTTARRIVNTGLEYQIEKGSTIKVNSPKNTIAAHQTQARARPTNKAINFLVFVQLTVFVR